MPVTDDESCTIDDEHVALVEELLQGTSRTFALAIPLLGPPLRLPVGLAYLLFRVADSIEDAPDEQVGRKLKMFQVMAEQLRDSSVTEPDEGSASIDLLRRFRWNGALSSGNDHAAIGRLFEAVPQLFNLLARLETSQATVVRRSLLSTIEGMSEFLSANAESENEIEIHNLEELRRYCYFVAGVVGEMLSELFLLEHPAGRVVEVELRQLGRAFGECLQLTNILKDSGGDTAERRVFIPPSVARAEVFELAFSAAEQGHQYLRLLQQYRFPDDLIRFCTLPLILAEQTLHRVHRDGPASKLHRSEVMEILRQVMLQDQPDRAMLPELLSPN